MPNRIGWTNDSFLFSSEEFERFFALSITCFAGSCTWLFCAITGICVALYVLARIERYHSVKNAGTRLIMYVRVHIWFSTNAGCPHWGWGYISPKMEDLERRSWGGGGGVGLDVRYLWTQVLHACPGGVIPPSKHRLKQHFMYHFSILPHLNYTYIFN